MSKYTYISKPVYNRGHASDIFLDQMIAWGRISPDEIFKVNNEPDDVMNLIKPVLAPDGWIDLMHRRCAMLEMMRVLGGFESSWNWNEGPDVTNPSEDNPETMSAGAWQCSWNSRSFGQDLKYLAAKNDVTNGDKFQAVSKADHPFAMEWVARLTRYTTRHHGPLKRKEVLPWLNPLAMGEFRTFVESDIFP